MSKKILLLVMILINLVAFVFAGVYVGYFYETMEWWQCALVISVILISLFSMVFTLIKYADYDVWV